MVMEIEVGGAEFGGRAEWRKGVGGKCDGAGITENFTPTSRSEVFSTPPDVDGRNRVLIRFVVPRCFRWADRMFGIFMTPFF